MTSERPLRTSARQSALRQQEQEAELARQRERISLANDKEQTNPHNEGHNHNAGSDSSSSRSLSPALSDSASLSSEGGGRKGEGDEEAKARMVVSKEDNSPVVVVVDDDDATKPFSDPNLQSYWEIAFVYGFLIKFRPLLRQNCALHEFSVEDIEEGLLSKSSNACIEEIHANLLSNMLNRKKAVDTTTWQRVLLDTLDTKHKSNDLEYDYNPLRYYRDYYHIPPEDRIHLLKALVHWVLQEAFVIRSGLEEDGEHYGTLRVFKENKHNKKQKKVWETVAINLEDVKALADSFNGTSSRAERALQQRIHDEIIQPTEERIIQNQQKKERIEKRMLKLAQLHQMASTRTTRTRSSNRLNQPKYTFDDDEDEFEDEYDLHKRPSSRRRQGNKDSPEETEQQAGNSIGNSKNYHNSDQQDPHEQRERSASADAESSIGRDSDTSILDALQRARVRDDDSFIVGSQHDSGEGTDEEEEELTRAKDKDFLFEEDRDDDDDDDDDERVRSVVLVSKPLRTNHSFTRTSPPVAIAPLPTPAPTVPKYVALVETTVAAVSKPVLVPAPASAELSAPVLTDDIEMKNTDV
ncbi:hypothetical protein BGZ65_001556 [Modicella reniformis]|uniref:DDT domain-containing protein n=1 Tax=Modicella reniformis TaxID=1440133 RepID=A0A9P6M9Z7_9FUNG|nr:hypothetical protein BGZ65_001556 [Modicella reniformis]